MYENGTLRTVKTVLRREGGIRKTVGSDESKIM
jgi:hypothetical protein